MIIVEEGLSRGSWPLGRILDTIVSDDGLARSVRLKKWNGSELIRPMNMIVPLEISSDD